MSGQTLPSKGECWILLCQTGCSCCRADNFIEGPYFDESELDRHIEYNRNNARLSSQYSESGVYSKIKIPYEFAGQWLILEDTYALQCSLEDGQLTPPYPQELDCYKADYRL